MLWGRLVVTSAALVALSAAAARAAEPEAPRTAGVDVPAPEVKKKVDPVYPPEALKQGVSGIVIVEVIIDESGNVVSAELVRSIPALDAAALAAVRQWRFEPTRVDGKPVRVRHVLALSFTRRLPEISRQSGIPELRDGSAPAVPRVMHAPGPVEVVAEITLAADGSVTSVELQRGEQPWADALLTAVRGWRFAPGDAKTIVSFRIEARFLDTDGAAPHVSLRLAGLRRSETLAPASPEATPGPPPAPAGSPQAPRATPPDAATSATPAPSLDVPAPEAEVEVISAPRVESAAPPAPSTLPGSSALVGVLLGAGVPDLVSGRRPVVPPFARIHGTSGAVEVRFSIDGAGKTTVHEVTGPDLLKPQADEAVRSWAFRRTTPERLFLVATFTYEGPKATAAVELRH